MQPMYFLAGLLLATTAGAEPCATDSPQRKTINHANLFIEDNAGDGDLGVHGYFDDTGWSELCVFDPSGDLILHVQPSGLMGDLGIAGVFFESREPEYAEWDYAALKLAWPEGAYSVRAVGFDGVLLDGSAQFTTVLPEMPRIIRPASVPEPDAGPLPTVPLEDMVVEWVPVTGSQDGRPITIRGYQLIVAKENHVDLNGFSKPVFDVHVGPHLSSLVIPAAFLDPGSTYEIEVLAIEASGNQTIGGASFFRTE